MGVVDRRVREREEAIRRVAEWVGSIEFPVTAVVIGSYARGDFNLWSDVDVLLVSADFPRNPLERMKALDPPPGVEAIPLRPEEFERMLARGEPMALDALRHGVVLRDDLLLLGARRTGSAGDQSTPAPP